jgi:hypothetical protein
MSAANAVDISVWLDFLVCGSGIVVGLLLAPVVVAIVNTVISIFDQDCASSVRFSLFSASLLDGASIEADHSAVPSFSGRFLFYLILFYGIALELVIQQTRRVRFRLRSLGLKCKDRSFFKFYSSNKHISKLEDD